MFWMWFWFCLSILLLVVELLTADLICIWFGASALLVGILLAVFPALPIAWQFVIFVFASAGLLAATRPLVKRFLHFFCRFFDFFSIVQFCTTICTTLWSKSQQKQQ